jgi:voltage-gated potassium channel
MITSTRRDLLFINPNWSAFVLMLTFLSVFNFLISFLPLVDDAEIILLAVNAAISGVLWADFIYLLRNSTNKRDFLVAQRGWMVLLGNLSPLRILRIIWFRLSLRKSGYTLGDFIDRIVIKQSAGGTLLTVLFIGIVVFEVAVVAILNFEETTPGSNITSISDAFWWASSTVATVGYGDKYPVSHGGRVIAILLMAVGIALFSVITSALAEWFRGRQHPMDQQRSEEIAATAAAVVEIKQLLEHQIETHQQTVAELKGRIDELEQRVK